MSVQLTPDRPLLPPHRAAAPAPLLVTARRRQGAARDTALHRHPRGQLLGTLGGLLTVTTATGTMVLPPVSALWLPPGAPHAARSHGPFDGWSVYVAPAAYGDLPATPRVVGMSGLLREAVLRACSWPPDGTALTPAQERLAGDILDEIAGPPDDAFTLPLPTDPRLARVAQALAADPADDRPMTALSAAAWVAPRTLSRRFPQQTGLTFAAWRQRARLLRALELLAAGTPVTTVAFDLGYDSVSSFIRAFRLTFGSTPGRYFDGAGGQ
ncbi:helix-turn-helix transcriptional regulator [Caenispirillum bisanense]|uniref:AraC family transcriptional regulator n=1 Tax=Caenispirillum bisanense TaxID=414052 RepID=UPI0031D7AFA7